jgi:hypothetical protein
MTPELAVAQSDPDTQADDDKDREVDEQENDPGVQ